MAKKKDNSLEPNVNEATENEAVVETEEVTAENAAAEVAAAEVAEADSSAAAEVAEAEVAAEDSTAEAEVAVAQPKKEGFGAKAKEWLRKQIVSLKRTPQRIPLVFISVVSVIWLLWLFTFSQSAYAHVSIDYAGLAIFVNTLLSILIIFLFLNAFPKRKKPNIVLIVLVFVFMAAMIGMDVLYYVQVYKFIYVDKGVNAEGLAQEPYMLKSLTYAIVHIVLQGLSIILFALFPVYKRLLLKINTNKVIAGNDINEAIDIED